MGVENEDKDWNKKRRVILFFAGLLGIFVYLGITEFLGRPFHVEFLLIFAAMMGISVLQGVEKL